MRILGIETSCDETAVCLIEAEGTFDDSFQFKVLGNALISQTAVHAPYGGVFPNLAKREHSRNLVPLLKEVLEQSFGNQNVKIKNQSDNAKFKNEMQQILHREPELLEQLIPFFVEHERPDIDAIAVTHGPGLEPALWVGVNFAKALSLAWDLPIVPVNHLEGHIAMAAVDMSRGDALRSPKASPREFGLLKFEFPAIALLISGGHTELDFIERWPVFKTLGETRDDAVGEAFDKVARMLGLPYPGGPHISALAEMSRKDAERTRTLSLPRPMLREDNFDFSFSGLKTAVLRQVKDKKLADDEKAAIAREFEGAAADVLVSKTLRAVEEYGAQTVLVGGGVSANTHIRHRLAEALAETGTALLTPPPEWATDNALMIALAGYFHALNKEFIDVETLRANGNLKLGTQL